MARNNPFTPTFGKIPPHFAGRESLLRSMHDAFENGPGDPNLSTVLVGARGTGKTALLSSIAHDASSCGWVSADVSAAPGMLEDIIQRAQEASDSFVEREDMARIRGLSLGNVLEVELGGPSPSEPNWRTRMNRLLDQLSEHDVGLLITVDEVVLGLDEMVQLATTYQHFVREDRKVALVLAGLPYQVSSLLSDSRVSFLRRCRKHQLGSVSDGEIASALRATVADSHGSITDDAVTLAVQAIEGFPYMMQLVGYHMWALSKCGDIDESVARRGIRLARQEMIDGVVETTIEELSAGDVRFLMAMLPDERESTLPSIAKRLGVKSNYASEYKRRLLTAGVLEERLGLLRFAIPGLREYLESI